MTAFHSAAVAHHARMTAPEFADGPFSRVYFVHADAAPLILEGQAGEKL